MSLTPLNSNCLTDCTSVCRYQMGICPLGLLSWFVCKNISWLISNGFIKSCLNKHTTFSSFVSWRFQRVSIGHQCLHGLTCCFSVVSKVIKAVNKALMSWCQILIVQHILLLNMVARRRLHYKRCLKFGFRIKLLPVGLFNAFIHFAVWYQVWTSLAVHILQK